MQIGRVLEDLNSEFIFLSTDKVSVGPFQLLLVVH